MAARRHLAALAILTAGLGSVAWTSTAQSLESRAPAAPRTFEVTATMTPDTVLRNERATLTGTVSPVRTDTRVIIQRHTDDGWIKIAKRTMNDDGSYRFALKPSSAGTYTFRARMPQVGSIGAGHSAGQDLTVAEEALVVFKIPAGTGGQDWNTEATTVTAEVGDTLRIVNRDVMAHEPHTDGTPFPHPSSEIAPGGSADYVLETTYDSTAGHTLYCHLHGSSSHFWLDVVEP
jgi:plastocyanin